MARRGARALLAGEGDGAGAGGPSASDLWRQAVAGAAGPPPEGTVAEGRTWEPEEVWVAEVPGQEEAASGPRSVQRPSSRTELRDVATGREGIASPGGRRRRLPPPVADEIATAAGADRGSRLSARLADASYAYEKERYQDASRILRALVRDLPGSPAVRELYGLVLYQTGQWAPAARQLEVYRHMTDSLDQHPVLADCYRALHRYDDAAELWEELRSASPSGDLVAEGRMVAAGCLADRGDIGGAIRLLESGSRRVKHPRDRHLRQWYALADLYERAGDVTRARDVFSRIAAADPSAYDAGRRLRSLR